MDVNEVKDRINENKQDIEDLAKVIANLKIRIRVLEIGFKKSNFEGGKIKLRRNKIMYELIDKLVVKRHEISYGIGINHKYPNENMVRLTKWFFPKRGKVLDYGFGPGENLLHLLRIGHMVAGIEVSTEARKITEKKLKEYPLLKKRCELYMLTKNDKRLPYKSNSFDYILSNQTVYFLNSEKKIRYLLKEFNRILKPNGRIIISMMSRFNRGCTAGKYVGNNCYEYFADGLSEPNKVYIVKDEDHIRKLFDVFKINEIGYFDNYYCGEAGHHFVVLASKSNSVKQVIVRNNTCLVAFLSKEN